MPLLKLPLFYPHALATRGCNITSVRQAWKGGFRLLEGGKRLGVERKPEIKICCFTKAFTRLLSLTCQPACLFPPFSKFSHPNILKQLGVCLLNEPQYIILELMEGGDLLTYLRKARMTPVGNGLHAIGLVTQMTFKFLLNLLLNSIDCSFAWW